MKSHLFHFCLVAYGVTMAMAAKESGVAEFDLIFPHNDTYDLMPLMPLVFAVQSPSAASLLNPELRCGIRPLGSTEPIDYINYSLFLPHNDSNFFSYHGIRDTLNTEGQWELGWSLNTGNCTSYQTRRPFDRGYDIEFNEPFHIMVFTTKKGGKKPDLVAASSAGECNKTQSFTFDIEKYINVQYHADDPVDSITKCAVLATSPSPTANPCHASIEPSVASSISASLTATVCQQASPPVSCPAESGSNMLYQNGWMLPLATSILFLLQEALF